MPTKNLPAKRHDIFQTAFERHVAHIQQQVRQAEEMQAPYNAVRDALDLAALPNDTQLSMRARRVNLDIVATEADVHVTFDKLADMIGERLRERGLHGDGIPAVDVGGYWHRWSYMWQIASKGTHRVIVEITAPRAGLRDLQWIETTTMVPNTVWMAEYRQPPEYDHGPFSTVCGDAEAVRMLNELVADPTVRAMARELGD